MMRIFECAFVLCLWSACCSSLAFTSRPTTLWQVEQSSSSSLFSSSSSTTVGATGTYLNTLTMRDLSASYWFKVGQQVKVVDDVYKAGANLRGRQGTVISTFEKCDVDPTCCCAEQVDLGMAVQVEFSGSETDETNREGMTFVHYFAEDELLEVKEEQPQPQPQHQQQSSSSLPFDGQSCVAFKLDHLKMGQQAQRIAAFEASQEQESDG